MTARRAADKVLALPQLLHVVAAHRAAGQRVALTNGAFDLIHVGHLRSLEQARDHADLLVVGINSDASVQRYKSPDRPIVPEADRAELIAGLACVDYVTIFDESTAERLLSEVRPDVYAKGEEYATRPFPERDVVEGYGGRVVLIPLEPGRSTTELIRRSQGTRVSRQ
jgi:rfaE bifunctional protein nucleotidyltransferase chain/domain